ncbi:GMP synthase (glutamine-hydrolysing) [Actinomyces ruminicola]|uniref:GMP synthase (Glutamine-hydrolysing) n=2 Tax=Actinomyces ruminicola TaxID=332524 RepID=A0A1G9Z6S2_9ACTO|nr:GMP synthase (glutamine-hydrolysing) [Actinomyces ruminicola]
MLAARADDEPADAEYEAFLLRTGLDESTLVRHRLEAEPMPDIDLADWSGIIVGGSPFNTSTPQEAKDQVQLRVEGELNALITRLLDADFPFLGACYGLGLLTHHQGGVVDDTYSEEVSYPQVELTDAGRADPLCAGMPAAFSAFVAHTEAVAAPPAGGVVLASSATCPVQVLRVRNNLYATQFHPELDGDYLAHRLAFYAGHGYFDDDRLPEIQDEVRRQDVSDSWKVLSNFVARYAR